MPTGKLMAKILPFKRKDGVSDIGKAPVFDIYADTESHEYLGFIELMPITNIACFHPSEEFYFTAGQLLIVANVMLDIEESYDGSQTT